MSGLKPELYQRRLQHAAPLDLVGGREEGEMKDILEIYTTRHIRKIARKNFII